MYALQEVEMNSLYLIFNIILYMTQQKVNTHCCICSKSNLWDKQSTLFECGCVESICRTCFLKSLGQNYADSSRNTKCPMCEKVRNRAPYIYEYSTHFIFIFRIFLNGLSVQLLMSDQFLSFECTLLSA